MWLLFSVLTAFCWALGGVLLKPAYKKLSTSQIYTLNGISFLAFWILYKLLTHAVVEIPKNIFILLPILSPLAFMTFIYAIKKGKVSIVSAVSSASIIISTTLAAIFLHEFVGPVQILLTVVMVSALVLLGLIEKKVERNGNFVGFLWGVIAAAAFGVSNTVSKYVLNNIATISFSIINGAWMVFLSLVWLGLDRKIGVESWEALRTYEGKRGIIGSAVYSLGGFFLFLALEKGLVSLVIPISNLSTPLALVFSLLLLKERVTPIQRLLIGVIFLAAVVLPLL